MNREQKRKIIGVAVISGVILVSVASVGITQLVKESNATQSNKYITAQATNMKASTASTTLNGITYSLDTTDYIATVASIIYDNATCAYSPNTKVFSINIPESISYNNHSYTVKYFGEGKNKSVFEDGNTSIKTNLSNLGAEKLVVILNKSITEVRDDAFTGYKGTYLKELRVVALSNEITFEEGCINTDPTNGLYANVVTVPGTDTSKIQRDVDIPNITVKSLYNISKNDTNQTATINGFTDGAVFDGVCDANSSYVSDFNSVICNIKIPDKVIIEGKEYIITKIADNAFKDKQRLKNVIIPATVSEIGSYAFSNSAYLNYLVFLGTNTNINNNILNGSTFNKIYALEGSTAEAFCKSKDSSKLETVDLYSINLKKNPSKITYKVGESINLEGIEVIATFNTTGIAAGKSIIPISDLKIVDPASGKADTIGNKRITITHKNDTNNTKTQSYEINVVSEDIKVSSVEITCSDSRFDSGAITIDRNETVKFESVINPSDATNKNVTWTSSNTAVATVSNGIVTGKSGGTATITVTTEDGNKTSSVNVKVVEDTTSPVISSVKGEKDSNGIYKVIIKVTDDTGVEKILVNGTEITTKDDEGNYYFIPTQNGEYKIEAYDKAGNKAEYTYTENNVITETKITPDKDSEGNNIIYIETITNKEVDKVKVNGTEITAKDDEGRYCFKPSENGTYTIDVIYKDGTTERKTYNETRFTENDKDNSGNNNSGDNNGNSENSGNNNSGNNGNSSNNSNSGNSGNSGNGTIGNSNNGSDNTTGKTGDTITTSTALTELPKTGSTMEILFAAIASGISAIFAWLKQKRQK